MVLLNRSFSYFENGFLLQDPYLLAIVGNSDKDSPLLWRTQDVHVSRRLLIDISM